MRKRHSNWAAYSSLRSDSLPSLIIFVMDAKAEESVTPLNQRCDFVISLYTFVIVVDCTGLNGRYLIDEIIDYTVGSQ